MKRSAISLFVFFVLLVIPGSSQNSDSKSADILFVNGRIYTAYPAQAWADASAVKGQSIVAVVKNSELREYQGPKTTVIDLHGRMAMSGIIDCHTHFLRGSQGLGWIDLEGASAAEAAKQRIRRYASSHPQAAWVRGGGWLYAPALEISKTRVELTMVGGRIVYQDHSLAGSGSQGGGRSN